MIVTMITSCDDNDDCDYVEVNVIGIIIMMLLGLYETRSDGYNIIMTVIIMFKKMIIDKTI